MNEEDQQPLDSSDYLNLDSAQKLSLAQRQEQLSQEHQPFDLGSSLSKLPYASSTSNFLNLGQKEESPGKKSPSPMLQHFQKPAYQLSGVQS
jgi:hypothetical protein